MTEDFDTIRIAIDQRGIARLTLNRPEKHNALNAAMIADLRRAADQIAAAAGKIRAVVLDGAGKTFCAGGDLGWMKDQAAKDRMGKLDEARGLAEMLAALNDLPQPLIARVHNAAYGGGIGMMCVADLAIVAEGCTFALSETRLGLIPATIGPFVIRRMGEGFARQVFFTAQAFGTDLALRAGLAAEIVPEADLDAAVERQITAILATAPGAVASAKALAKKLGGPDPRAEIEMTINALADRWEDDEAATGIAAFFARETPPWAR